MKRLAAVVAAALVLGAAAAGLAARQTQEAERLRLADPPPNGIWVDSLDMSRIAATVIRVPRGRGAGRGGAQPGVPPAPAAPPAPPVYTLGGVTYPHTVPMQSDRDLSIDLKGQALRFASMVGIDSSVAAGRGSVIFGVWVDGRKAADSGVLRGGDPPRLVTADLKGAGKLTLAVIDANDGTGSDTANWGGALLTMAPDAAERPEILAPAVEPMPPIASSRSSVPLLNYPRITGATPGKPFMFLIPASGNEPLKFAAKNLPAGLTLDPKTGLITGSLKGPGRTPVEVTVTNARGKATGTITIVGGDNALALTPPLGWNSWNAWGNTVTAERVRLSADGMVKSGLHRQGYTYINIDDVWEGGLREPRPHDLAASRDASGEPTTNERFPDMKGLVDHIHSLGLKAGLYSSPGPTTCQGLGASYRHEEQDARAYARWGFDYLKYDWCGYSQIAPKPTLEDRQKPYRLMGEILRRQPRDIVFSICQYGQGNVWEWGRDVGGHLWRMTGDIRDNWPSMTSIGFQQTGREQYAGPGGWNDTDMLVVGMVGWSQGQRPSDLTPNEQLTHIALWALQAAPLLIGADLSKIDEWTTNLLGNREMLAVNQDELGKPAGRKMTDGWVEVWARPLADGTIAAGLFNRGPEAANVTATWADLGLRGPQPVRDIWLQKDLGRVDNQLSATVPRHGVLFVKIGAQQPGPGTGASLVLRSPALAPVAAGPERSTLTIDGLYYETAEGRTLLPAALTPRPKAGNTVTGQAKMPDGRVVRLMFAPDGRHQTLQLSAEPATGILRWGLAIDAAPDEYYTGLMERVVEGPQRASWEPGITAAMNLRGQGVDMIVKPTTSVYAPFYLSSRGYAVFVKGTWPGHFDFAARSPKRVTIDFEGPSLEMKVYLNSDPAALVRDHAMDAGPPVLPPKWMLTPWRWRDEHSHRAEYYDGTPVTGPFNSQVMEDVLLMKAFGIPNGVYWVDRPYGPGRLGYDDFEIDPKRLPNFAEMVQWLNGRGMQMMLWIAPFFQGQMEKDALAKGYQLAGQPPQPNNYPLADFTNPAARAFWQAGFSKLLELGVASFKLDRGEENIPEEGPFTVFDGRSVREQRNAYPVMFIQAAYEEAKKRRGDDFLLMPRGAYTGSSRYGAFWGGDIGGTQEGLRASIIAVQRAAVMGYPFWGSDTCGYNQQLMEQEVCARWLAFSAFTPIMEVGPTRNVGFWNLPREPSYDEVLIATWRLYARLHQRLADYAYRCVREAASTGMPIVRPLFLVEPKAPRAWTDWSTYLYGPDIVVSPIWEKGRREGTVYLPSGGRWRDAWRPGQVHEGGRSVTVGAEVHQIPLFVREGSGLDLGDLNREYVDAMAAAKKRPDLKALDAEVAAWFKGR